MSYTNVCNICHEIAQCPVTLNGFPIDGVHDISRPKKCKFSQSNPLCLLCVRDYMSFQKKQKKNGFKCFSNCCWITIRGWETYGEIGREPQDVAEPTLWRFMGKNGVTICRKCNVECNNVYDLGMHLKNKCIERNVNCPICFKSMSYKNLEEHLKNCKIYCVNCEEELEVINDFDILNNNTCDENGLQYIKIHKHKIKTGLNSYEIRTQRKPFIVKQHFCYELPIGNCKICNNPIKFMNLHEHKSCTMSISDHKENSNY